MLEAVGVRCLLPLIESGAFWAGRCRCAACYKFKLDGSRFAFELESRVGDQLSRAQREAIEVNSELLSFYFEKPRS
jgi:hypothetical protein